MTDTKIKASRPYRRMLKSDRRASVSEFDYRTWQWKPLVTLFGVRAGERSSSNRGAIFRMVGADPDHRDSDGDRMYRSYLEFEITDRLIFDHGTIQWEGYSEEGLRIRHTADEWEDELQPLSRIPFGFAKKYQVRIYSPAEEA